jgi:hypothetical protein
VSHLSISMFLKSLMPLVHVPVMLGMPFGMEHLFALPVEQFHWSCVSFLPDFTLLSSSIGAVSCSFPISRFRTQRPTQYYILHRAHSSRACCLLGQVCPGSTPPSWVHSFRACFLLTFSIKQL